VVFKLTSTVWRQKPDGDDEAPVLLMHALEFTVLHHATSKGKVHAAEALIELGASVDSKDQRGYTPLHTAALNGFHTCIALLLSKGTTCC